jgi:hypothetical protein
LVAEFTMQQLVFGMAMQAAIFALPAIVVVWLLRGRFLRGLAFPSFGRSIWAQLAWGAASAAAVLAVAILPPLAAGQFAPGAEGYTPFAYGLSARDDGAHKLALLLLVQTFWEEALFRGMGCGLLGALLYWLGGLVFQRSPDEHQAAAGRRWLVAGSATAVIVALAFGIVHLQNPGVTSIATVNVVLAGVWLGLLFTGQASLWGVWAGHFVWNFITALAGLPVSGIPLADDTLGAGLNGATPGLFSGGSFGPEGSVGCTVGLLAVVALQVWHLRKSPPVVAEGTEAQSVAASSDSVTNL